MGEGWLGKKKLLSSQKNRSGSEGRGSADTFNCILSYTVPPNIGDEVTNSLTDKYLSKLVTVSLHIPLKNCDKIILALLKSLKRSDDTIRG
jgi:hypothetical protein